MSALSVVAVKSQSTSPPVFQRSDGTEIGQLCRAWVNFNGTGTPAIRAAFNVSSITDNGTGDYTVNFTNALPDANYGLGQLVDNLVGTSAEDGRFFQLTSTLAGSCRGVVTNSGGTASDAQVVSLLFFR